MKCDQYSVSWRRKYLQPHSWHKTWANWNKELRLCDFLCAGDNSKWVFSVCKMSSKFSPICGSKRGGRCTRGPLFKINLRKELSNANIFNENRRLRFCRYMVPNPPNPPPCFHGKKNYSLRCELARNNDLIL